MVGTDAVGALLAPETGGLSLAGAIPLGAALAASGSVAGKAAQNKLTGQNVTSGLGGAAAEGAIGGAAGPVIGKVVGGVTDALSSKLISEGDDAAVKSLGLSQANRNAFFKATGQTASDFLKEQNLAGEGTDAVKAAQDALQTQYNNIARNSGIKVPIAQVVKDLAGSLGDSDLTTPQGEASADQAYSTLKTIIKNLPQDGEGNVDIGDLTNAKSNIQSQTNFDATRPGATQKANEAVSNSLMGTINNAAEEAGLTSTDGKPLSVIGQTLNRFRTITGMIGSKEPGTVGSGTLAKVIGHAILPGTGAVIGGAIGGLTGGESGAATGAEIGGGIGAGSEALLQSPAVLSKLATVLPAISSKLAPQVSDVAAKAGLTGTEAATASLGPSLSTPLSVATSIPGRLVGNSAIQDTGTVLGQQSLPASPSLSDVSSSTSPAASQPTGSADPLQSGIAAIQAGQPLSTAQYTALEDATSLMPKLQAGITAAYQASNPTVTQGLGIASGVTNSLQNLYNAAGGGQGLVMGNIENVLSPITKGTANAYNQQKLALGQEIINQIYGSTGTASDRDQVLSLIPDLSDSPANAASKLAQLRNMIQTRLQATQGATPTSVTATNSGPSLSLQP
jgi:hypothetical protein